ncbi:MAG: VTT domain-containing protein [Gluconacetobacter diazotrophicus]|nr:VTT domain-containing protein [Gluconacetobacter diazotrophicus]
MLLALLALGMLLRHLKLSGDGSPLAAAALRDGLRGRLLFLGLGTLFCAAGLPRQLVCFAAGLAFGVAAGTGYALSATVAGCALAYGWARLAAPAAATRRVGAARGWRAGRLARFGELARRRPFGTVLTLRLLPVGSSLLLNLAAGLLRVPPLSFVLATALGALPQTLVFVLLGGGARIGHAAQLASAVALFAASGALGLWLMRGGGRRPG